jgi:hypothetical protein
MRKGNGGIIGPLNTPSQAVATGMWSMDEQQQNLGARSWPGTPAATKPNSPSFANSCTFTASISNSTMTVTAIATGALAVGQVISGGTTGNFVTQYTIITAQLTGTSGSTGTYTVSKGQTVNSTSMSSTVVITSVTTSTSSVQIPFVTGYDGGSPVTAITAKVYAGSTVYTASGTSSPLTVTSLPNNVVYSVTLSATNAIGTSAVSTGPYFQTPAVPAAPTIGSASLVSGSVQVSFTAPTSNNGSTITGYTAVSSPGGITTSGASSPITMTGLAAGTSYTFTVYATNAIGNSASSAASNSVTTLTPSASGGVLTFDGAYSVRTFTSNDTLTVTGGALTCDVMLIGGGGAGGLGAGSESGGGGAGGLVYIQNYSVSSGSYAVTIGTGGIPQYAGTIAGGSGADSTLGSGPLLIAKGGGYGATAGGSNTAAQNGGSGGGAASRGGETPGSATQPSQSGNSGTYGFGYRGGNSSGKGSVYAQMGGGGAGAAAADPPATNPPTNNFAGYPGGIGKSVGIKVAASPEYYAGGGGGFDGSSPDYQNIPPNLSAIITGSISETTLTITSINSAGPGYARIGQQVSGTGVTPYTKITGQISGTTGQAGTYTVDTSQNVSSRTMNLKYNGGGKGGGGDGAVSGQSFLSNPGVNGYGGGGGAVGGGLPARGTGGTGLFVIRYLT